MALISTSMLFYIAVVAISYTLEMVVNIDDNSNISAIVPLDIIINIILLYYKQMTPDGKQRQQSKLTNSGSLKAPSPAKNDDEDSFFDLLSKFQSKRMDDQRCSLQVFF